MFHSHPNASPVPHLCNLAQQLKTQLAFQAFRLPGPASSSIPRDSSWFFWPGSSPVPTNVPVFPWPSTSPLLVFICICCIETNLGSVPKIRFWEIVTSSWLLGFSAPSLLCALFDPARHPLRPFDPLVQYPASAQIATQSFPNPLPMDYITCLPESMCPRCRPS